jgi:hypothetical protein
MKMTVHDLERGRGWTLLEELRKGDPSAASPKTFATLVIRSFDLSGFENR